MRLKYDKDFGWTRRLFLFLVALNVLSSIAYAFHHAWADAAAGVIWTINFFALIRWNRQCQEQRDHRRLLEAALNESLRREP